MSDLLNNEVKGLNRDPAPKEIFKMRGRTISEDKNISNIQDVERFSNERVLPIMQKLFVAERFEELIEILTRFYNNSARNALAVYEQNPEATLVLGADQWKALGCRIDKEATPMEIINPVKYLLKSKAKKYTGFKIGNTYDISNVIYSTKSHPFVEYSHKRITKQFAPETPETLSPILIQHMLNPFGKSQNPLLQNNSNLESGKIFYNNKTNKIEMNLSNFNNSLLSDPKVTMDMLKSIINVNFTRFNLPELYIGGREAAVECAAHAVAKYFDFDDGGLSPEIFSKTIYDAKNDDLRLQFLDNISKLSRFVIKAIEEIDFNAKSKIKYPNL